MLFILFLNQAMIDQDNALIEKLLADGKFEEATLVYENGSFSRSYALLHLKNKGLPGVVDAHSLATGVTVNSEAVTGTVLEPGKHGDKAIRVLYHNSDGVGSCFVGGNPDPTLNGCKYAKQQNPIFHTNC
jgi:hypothetical protein